MNIKTFIVSFLAGAQAATVARDGSSIAEAEAASVAAGDFRTMAVKTWPGPSGFGNADALRQCINDLRNNPRWDNWNCAGRYFQIGGSSWNSPGDCIGGCTPFLLGAAEMGLHWAKCDQDAGISARCWVGWCPIGQHTCGNSDGSCCND